MAIVCRRSDAAICNPENQRRYRGLPQWNACRPPARAKAMDGNPVRQAERSRSLWELMPTVVAAGSHSAPEEAPQRKSASWGINAIDPHKAQGLSREYPSRVGVPSLWLQQSPEPLWIDDQHPAILKGCDGSSGLNGTWRRLPPMPNPQSDTRSESRKVRDEELAAAPMLPIPAPSPGDAPQPLEAYLPPRRPVAVLGIVENGVVRLLGEGVSIPEHSRVIVVASDAG